MNQTPLQWTPYQLVSVDPELSKSCFIGRAVAMRINGVECIVMTRAATDLENVGDYLTDGAFDVASHYKATLIQSDGVEIIIPENPPELPVNLPPAEQEIPPVVPEVPAKPTKQPKVPLYEGSPVVTYADPGAAAGESTASEEADVPVVRFIDPSAQPEAQLTQAELEDRSHMAEFEREQAEKQQSEADEEL